jgi:hypothetical protein
LDGDRKSNSVLDGLRFLRGLGESYSDVILRLVGAANPVHRVRRD